jgi:hypothetical protein
VKRKATAKRPSPDNRRAALPAPEFDPEREFDFHRTLHKVRDRIDAADAMIAAADELIIQLWSDDTAEDILRRRNRVSHYMEAALFALREARDAGNELDLHRRDA